MRKWGAKILEKVKGVINFRKKSENNTTINEGASFTDTALKNMVWYRGDPNELQELHKNLGVSDGNFWGSAPVIKMHKIHTGLPSIMVDTLSKIVLRDMNDITIDDVAKQELWEEIARDNQFKKLFKKALNQVYYLGDGAFKINFNNKVTKYPILEFYGADRVEFVHKYDRCVEVIFKTQYTHKQKEYVLLEKYGKGYIKNELIKLPDNKSVPLSTIPELAEIEDVAFSGYNETTGTSGTLMLAIPFMIYESEKYHGRGKSVFDKKLSVFDALDEIVSQWMDAVRGGRAIKYIPESLLPRDPETGEVKAHNDFDNRFIKTEGSGGEDAKNKIDIEQPSIPSTNYLESYINFLDEALQGVISPSTIGIDVKKLDNAESQREKEKATLYTLNDTIDVLKELVPVIVETSLKAYDIFYEKDINYDVDCTVDWGEYANPSFEAVVETVAKTRPGTSIMSIEASVEELHGDSKDEEWKAEEVLRLKNEQGILPQEEVTSFDGELDVE